MSKSPPRPPALLDTAFDPYAIELGYLIHEWNNLQEKLCDVFTTVIGLRNGGVTSAVWYSTRSDQAQRDMLRGAANVALKDHPDALEKVAWLLNKADVLGNKRNDALHSPFSFVVGNPVEVVSRHFFGNPRAINLKGKKLLAEFRWYRDSAKALYEYGGQLEYALRLILRGTPAPLPDTPDLPSLGQKNIH